MPRRARPTISSGDQPSVSSLSTIARKAASRSSRLPFQRRARARSSAFTTLSEDHFQTLVAAYNNTPRKCLDWLTPAEAFSSYLLHFERESTSRLSPG